jgi:ribulose-phosphate 3-epimerase
MKPLIAPSILAADHTKIAEALGQVSNSDWVHVDIMDNHFVPNLSFSSNMTKAVKKLQILPVDTHLMISEPENWLSQFIEAGSDSITFHLEATNKPELCIEIIKKSNRQAAIAIKPKTDFSKVIPFLPLIDMVLVMTVEPGFGGQKFMNEQLEKVRAIRSEIDKSDLQIRLQVDGGIDEESIVTASEAGADFFVAGSSVFNAVDPALAVTNLRKLASK